MPDPDKLDHYVKTLEVLCQTHPDLAFLDTMRIELRHLCRQFESEGQPEA